MWMLVTKDEYELPLMIEDNMRDFARRCGVRPNTIYSSTSHAKKEGHRCRYVYVKD